MEENQNLLKTIKEKYGKRKPVPITRHELSECEQKSIEIKSWTPSFMNNSYFREQILRKGAELWNFKEAKKELVEYAELLLEKADKNNYLECKYFQKYLENILDSIGTYYYPSEALSIYVSAKNIKIPDFEKSKEIELEKLAEAYLKLYEKKDISKPEELISRLMAVCDNIKEHNSYYKKIVRNSLEIIVETLKYDKVDRLEESVFVLEKFIPEWREEFSLKNWNGYSVLESKEISFLKKIEQELSYNVRQNFLDKLEKAGKEKFEKYLGKKDEFETVRNLHQIKFVKNPLSIYLVDFEGVAESNVKSFSDFLNFCQLLPKKIIIMDLEIFHSKDYIPKIVIWGGKLSYDYDKKAGWYIVGPYQEIIKLKEAGISK